MFVEMALSRIALTSRSEGFALRASHWDGPGKRQRPSEKNGYDLNYIRAKRTDTSAAWINSIFLVMALLVLLR
jgi:hypothetical protein